MKNNVILKKRNSDHAPDVYLFVRELQGDDIIADLYILADEENRDRHIRHLSLPLVSVNGDYRRIDDLSPEKDFAHSLFHIRSVP